MGNWSNLAGPIKSEGKIEVQCEMYDINWSDIYQKHQGNWDLIKSMYFKFLSQLKHSGPENLKKSGQ